MTPSDLALSGLRYGANFATWKAKMEAALRVLGLLDFAKHEGLMNGSQLTTQVWSSKSQAAATIISAYVNPELFSRVSSFDRTNAKRQMDRLEVLALQFRFFELPAEIRTLIYDYLFDNLAIVKVEPLHQRISRYPAVTRTSRLLRTESLPIFYQRSTVHFSFISSNSPVDRKANANIAWTVRKWASKISRQHLKLIKTAELALRVQHIQGSTLFRDSSEKEVTFTISEKESLGFCSSDGLKPAS